MPNATKLVQATAAILALISSALPGCRVLRHSQASDDSVAVARQLSLQAMDAQQRGRFEQAESLFAEAVAKCPQDERAQCGYAEALWRRGNVNPAIVHMEQAVRLSGHDPQRLVELGQMYRGRGDLARADQQAARAIASNPQLARAWELRGDLLLDGGQLDEALASYHRALSYEPALTETQLAIARIYEQTNRPQQALATLQTLASAFPAGQTPVEILVEQGTALGALSRHRDAASVLAQVCQRGNPSADLLCQLAAAQSLAGDERAASESLAAALACEPGNARCLALAKELGGRRVDVAAVSSMPFPTEPGLAAPGLKR